MFAAALAVAITALAITALNSCGILYLILHRPPPPMYPQAVNPLGLLGWFDNVSASLIRIEQKVDLFMATWAESVQAWTDYATELQKQRDDAVAALTEAQASAQSAADALSAYQADDAATDAQQLADQAQQFADQLALALVAVKNPPPAPEPLPAEPPVEETPPE